VRRRVIVGALQCSACALFFAYIYLTYSYLNSGSSSPRPELGRVYVHDVHGQVVYIDFDEKWRLNGAFVGAAIAFIAAIAVSKWKRSEP